MRDLTRRATLGLLGTAALTGVAGARGDEDRRDDGNGRGDGNGTRPIERVLSTGQPVPENIAFDGDGDLYVGITGGSVRRLPADRTDETGLGLDATTEVASYPGGVAGVTVSEDTLYTAVNGESGSVFESDLGADDEPTELATVLPDGNGFVNDLVVDGDRLLATESFGGAVYEIDRDDGETAVWVADDLLDTDSFGANGIARVDDTVYVAVTRAGEVGRVVEVPVEDGGDAGSPETFVEAESLFGADGLTARGPQLYAAVNSANRITRITPSGELRTVVEGEPLSFPSEVVFDPTARGKAFVCNFSPSAPGAAGVLRTRP
jgi:sugar lactone lactonase YvrE